MNKINIAIDGHSSCGKSTIARSLAKKLSYLYVDSGAMYRTVTYYALQHKLIANEKVNKTDLLRHLSKINITFQRVDGGQHAFLNGVDVEFEIRSPKVSEYVSLIAKIPEVRKYLVEQQQELGKSKGVVMDGRDIGTVVFPSAEVKFYVTADVEVRAKRRYEEMLAKSYENISFEEIKQNIEERDFLDSHREVSPLEQANDAILIDTSHLSPEAQLKIAYDAVEAKLKSLNQ